MPSGPLSIQRPPNAPITIHWGEAPAEWDSQLNTYPQASIFHTTGWTNVLHQAYGFKPVYLRHAGGNSPPACLLLLEVNSRLTGRRGIGLPFTDYCEPLGANSESMDQLFSQAINLGKERKWKYLELRGGRSLLPKAQASIQFYGHIIDLVPSEEVIFARLNGSVRQAIRKAEKLGVTVEALQTLAAIETYYSLHCKTRQKHGLPPQPFAFFKAIYEHIISQDHGAVFVAKHENTPVAAAIHFHLNGEAVYKFGASDESLQQYRGNNLVMWEAIKWLRQQGCRRLHLGRSSFEGDGLRRYKLGFGANENLIEYIKYDLNRNCFLTEKDSAHGWHTQVFHWMPSRVARLVGTLLYPHIA